jgi:palmitoyltransferase
MVRPPAGAGTETQSVRIDGVAGEVRVQVRSSSAPVGEDVGSAGLVPGPSGTSSRSRSEELVNDIMALALADDANKIPQSPEGDETEDDFM